MDGERYRPILLLLIGVFAVSWAAILVRFCQAPALSVAAYRLTLSVVIVLPGYVFFRGRNATRPCASIAPYTALSGLLLGGHFIAWIEAVQSVPVAVAVTLSSTHPIFVAMSSWLWMKEKPSLSLVIGTLLALVGTGFISWSDQGMTLGELRGYGLALAASALFAGYVVVGRWVRRTIGLVNYVLPTYGMAALFLLALVCITGAPISGFYSETYLMFFLLALIPTVIGHSTLNWALRYVPATVVAVSVLGEPVGATILAALILGELPDLLKLCGGFIILVGIYMAARSFASGRPALS